MGVAEQQTSGPASDLLPSEELSAAGETLPASHSSDDPKGKPGLETPDSVNLFILNTGKMRPREAKALPQGRGGVKGGAWPHSQGRAPSGAPQPIPMEAQELAPQWEGATHSPGDGVHAQLHPVPVLVERVDLHDGGGHWVGGKVLGGGRKAESESVHLRAWRPCQPSSQVSALRWQQ